MSGLYPGHTQRLILGPFVETVPVHHVGNPLPLLLLMVLVLLTHFGCGVVDVSSSLSILTTIHNQCWYLYLNDYHTFAPDTF